MLGLLAGIFGSIYPIPQAIKAIRNKNSKGFSKWFLLLWFLDKSITLIYVCTLLSTPLIVKYTIGLICVLIITYFKFWGDKK